MKQNKNIPTSNVISNIKHDKNCEWYEGTAYINKFDKECIITIDDATIEYAEKCINYINNEMSTKLFNDICASLIRYCNYCINWDSDINLPKNIKGTDILKYISDIQILIQAPMEDTIGFDIAGNCEWEEEHGFAIVINDNKIKYVGEHGNIYSPWDEYSSEYNFSVDNFDEHLQRIIDGNYKFVDGKVETNEQLKNNLPTKTKRKNIGSLVVTILFGITSVLIGIVGFVTSRFFIGVVIFLFGILCIVISVSQLSKKHN